MAWQARAVGRFEMPAVHFSTAQFINSALSTGNSGLISISYWFKIYAFLNPTLWVVDPNNENSALAYNNQDYLGFIGLRPNLEVDQLDPLYADRLDVSTNTPITLEQWHHVLVSVDAALPVHGKQFKFYLDDADVTRPEYLVQDYGGGTGVWSTGGDAVTFYDGNNDPTGTRSASAGFAPVIAGLPFYIGGDGQGAGEDNFVGDLSEFWFAIGQSLLDGGDISEETRRKFSTSDGRPMALGANGELPTGTPPTIFGHGNWRRFLQPNLGTGGEFSLTGELTDADTHPRIGEP